MHAHIYIYNAQGRLRWNSHVNWNVKKEENEMYVGGGHAMAAMNI
jgi:hypothetical protein